LYRKTKLQEEFEDNKGVIGIHKSNDRYKCSAMAKIKRRKKRSAKHYTENKRSSDMNPTK
jgi:hypothetical protein